MPGDSAAASLLWLVVSAVVVAGLAYWVTRCIGGWGLPGGPARTGNPVRVLAQTGVGRDQRLMLVQVGERYFLLGAASSSISLLAEFTPEEAAAWQRRPETAEKTSFREALETVLKQRKRR